MFAIVPRGTFGCWFLLFCRSLCRSAGFFAVLLVYACLLASLLLYWPLCRFVGFPAALLVCCLRSGLPGDSRWPSLCLLMPGVFLLVVTLLPAAGLCHLHLLAGLSLLPSCQFGSPC